MKRFLKEGLTPEDLGSYAAMIVTIEDPRVRENNWLALQLIFAHYGVPREKLLDMMKQSPRGATLVDNGYIK